MAGLLTRGLECLTADLLLSLDLDGEAVECRRGELADWRGELELPCLAAPRRTGEPATALLALEVRVDL